MAKSDLFYGDQNDDVMSLQKLLNQQLGNPITVDGIYGDETQKAVETIQKQYGLYVDGSSVGTDVWDVLSNSSFPAKTPTSTNNTATSPTTPTTENKNTTTTTTKPVATAPTTSTSTKPTSTNTSAPSYTVSEFEHPEYGSAYREELDALMNSILNRDKFSYDIDRDALYQQYKDIYGQQAKAAAENAIGQAQAMTGGYGNSYAQSVGQQQYAQQIQNLNEVGLDLYDRALSRYLTEGDQLNNQYAMLADKEAQDYNRYLEDRNLKYQLYRDEVNDAQWQATMDYQTERDKVYDSQWQAELDRYIANDKQSQENWQAEMDYRAGRDTIEDEQWEKSFNASYGDGTKTGSSTVYEGGGALDGQEVPNILANVEGLTTDDTSFFDSNGKFMVAEYTGTDKNGEMIYRYNGKNVTVDKGTNPYTRTENTDIEYGTFGNGYQPNNVASYYGDYDMGKLTETGVTDRVNGIVQNVYKDATGKTWIWDDTKNEYMEYGLYAETGGDGPVNQKPLLDRLNTRN